MKYIYTLILLTITSVNFAQEDKVKAYLDCSRCDENFIKQETSFLDYVRDQDLADVVIFIRDIWNPSGGRSYEIEIDGNNEFTDIYSTTKVSGFSSDTSSSLRDKMVNKLKLALVPFLDKAEYDLNVKIDTNFDDLEIIDDKWKNWVLNYLDHIMEIKKKVEKLIGMKFNLKLIKLPKIGELELILKETKQIENSTVMTMYT